MRFFLFAGLALLAFGWEPNTGPECTLDCMQLTPIDDHCPAWSSSGRACKRSHHGCRDTDDRNCFTTVHRGTLCAVSGPCMAGPTGCREDKTGEDDGLPSGKHVGHCPKPETPEERCETCAKSCWPRSERNCRKPGEDCLQPDPGPSYQSCLERNCRGERDCEPQLLEDERISAASIYCGIVLNSTIADGPFEECLHSTVVEYINQDTLCYLRYGSSLDYCKELGHPPFQSNSQTCVWKSLEPVYGENLVCMMQFSQATTFCTKKDLPPWKDDFQQCVFDAFNTTCPNQYCDELFQESVPTCLDESMGRDGIKFDKCLRDFFAYRCPADTACPSRYAYAENFCNRKGYRGGVRFQNCMKDILGDVCPASTLCPLCREGAKKDCKAKGIPNDEMEKCMEPRCNITCAENAPQYLEDNQKPALFPIQLEL